MLTAPSNPYQASACQEGKAVRSRGRGSWPPRRSPPTAISTYATAAIAGADPWQTQWRAMLLALSGFLIPFSFAYDPAILLINPTLVGVLFRTGAATLGILMLGAGIVGYLWGPTRAVERLLLLAGSVLLIFPGLWGDLVGALAFVAVWASQRLRRAGALGAAVKAERRP